MWLYYDFCMMKGEVAFMANRNYIIVQDSVMAHGPPCMV